MFCIHIFDSIKRIIIMSKEEIDRILKQDLTHIDETINKRMRTMDAITTQITVQSGFLAQFQMLLMKELGEERDEHQWQEKSDQKMEFPQEYITQGELSSFNCLPEHQKSSKSYHQEQINSRDVECQTNFPSLQDEQRIKTRKLFEMIVKMREQVRELQLFEYSLSLQIKEQLYFQKQKGVQLFKNTIERVVSVIRKEEQQSLEILKQQNQNLKEEIKNLKTITRQPLKQLTFSEFNEENTSRVIQKALFKNQQGINQENRPINMRNLLIEVQNTENIDLNQSLTPSDSSYFFRDQPQQPFFTRRKPSTHRSQIKQIKVPDIKPILVGIPPIKNGFGILTSGSKVIYKGTWSNGNFQGKGKLTWNNYCYEGDFQKGLFSGYGKLTIDSTIFMGKFKNNQAHGQGTFYLNGQQIQGNWFQNKLYKRY